MPKEGDHYVRYFDFKQFIEERGPFFLTKYKEDWRNYEKLRIDFVRDYPINKIMKLSIEDYVIGLGADNKSFCYRLEQELDPLGRIKGATAFKFGIYHGQTKKSSSKDYRFSAHWGENKNEAFEKVKKAIVELLTNYDDMNLIKSNPISPMFKGKLLNLYYPDMFVNIFSQVHLSHFVSQLNIITRENPKEIDLNKSLVDYRNKFTYFKGKPSFLFSILLYDLFGYPPKDKKAKLPLVVKAAKNTTILDNHEFNNYDRNLPKIDYDARQKERRLIGDRGEQIVLVKEKNKLTSKGMHNLANQILHVSETDDSKGYDILSFDENGTPMQIEVKATVQPSFANGFYLTSNELNKSKTLDNYYLYLVSSVNSESPIINTFHRPAFSDESTYILIPTIFKVKFNED